VTGKRAVSAAWPTGGFYSQAIVVDRLVFLAGQTAGVPGSTELEVQDVAAQTATCVDRLRKILESLGGALGDVVKTTCFLADIDDFAEFDRAYALAFPEPPPARSTLQVGRFPSGLLVEIEAIALLPEGSETP
jgi:2-iminobutanoate/2-iminopropanoate deaminase